ncbi:MAG: hypothetical protein EOO24_50675, partial [Comamonadaceae bacterium]
MLQIIIQGRGGQGAQTAGNLLAKAYFAEGRQVQAFASYGGARRGTPVSSFLRVDDRPVRLRCDIERADAILCFDASLLQGALLAAAHADTVIVVNSARSAADFRQSLPGYRVIPVDGLAISRRQGPQQRGVDDAPQALASRDRKPVHRDDAVARQRLAEVRGAAGRVHDDHGVGV